MNANAVELNTTNIVIIGASGFIGEHLLNFLEKNVDIKIKVLIRTLLHPNRSNITFVKGDLLDSHSLDRLLSENCIVINLAYLTQHNLEAMTNLANACVRNKVRRLIHCSTAVVVGRTVGDLVTENTTCFPTSEYEHIKLQMEKLLLGAADDVFEVVVLRPTAVVGPGGKNLRKLADELMTSNIWINYVKSCLYNYRSMNLVCVENVVAALIFLSTEKNINGEIFIIADDDCLLNNYRDVEARLMKYLGKSYAVPRFPVPKFIFSAFLRFLGRSNINPSIKYCDQKLAELGFVKPQNLEIAIDNFAASYQDFDFI